MYTAYEQSAAREWTENSEKANKMHIKKYVAIRESGYFNDIAYPVNVRQTK